MTHLDIETLHRRPGDENHRVLRVRRCRQDDDWPRRSASALLNTGGSVVTLTIDPARRLAQSLGLARARQRAAQGRRHSSGTSGRRKGGELHAMMLDMKRTFDEIVEATRPREGRADSGEPVLPIAVVEFRRYAGVHGDGETRAAARLRPVGSHRRRHPTSRSALDFSMRRDGLARFLDGRFIRMLLVPAKVGGRGYRRSCRPGSAWSPER